MSVLRVLARVFGLDHYVQVRNERDVARYLLDECAKQLRVEEQMTNAALERVEELERQLEALRET